MCFSVFVMCFLLIELSLDRLVFTVFWCYLRLLGSGRVATFIVCLFACFVCLWLN